MHALYADLMPIRFLPVDATRVFQERVINHAEGSHGVSGSSLTVTVTEQR